MKVYILQHVHEFAEDREEVKLIGVYSTRNAALAAAARLTKKPGFVSTPDGFHVDEYQLDTDHWSDGFSEAKAAGGGSDVLTSSTQNFA